MDNLNEVAGKLEQPTAETGSGLRAMAPAVLFIVTATIVFSLSFVLVYGAGWPATWGIAIGAAAAISWVMFIVVLAKFCKMPLTRSLAICVATMVPGNVILLSCVIINVFGWAAGWSPPFWIHIAIICAANLVMYARFAGQMRNIFSQRQAVALWFGLQNGFFAVLLTIARAALIS